MSHTEGSEKNRNGTFWALKYQGRPLCGEEQAKRAMCRGTVLVTLTACVIKTSVITEVSIERNMV